MAQAKQFTFNYKELAALMVKDLGLSEGLWGVWLNFGIKGTNIGSSPDDLLPAAIVPVVNVGLQSFDEPNSLTVDAAEIVKLARPKRTRARVKK